MTQRINRLPDVKAQMGISRSTIYASIKIGMFIKPIKLGARAVGWLDSEVQAMLNARIAGKNDVQIRELVLNLELSRKSVGGQYAH